jgi:hypothetical protein
MIKIKVLFGSVFFLLSFNGICQDKNVKQEGFAFETFVGFNRSSSGKISQDNINESFNRDVNDNSGRFLLESYFIYKYFIFPKSLSFGLGTGFSKSYKPNFVQIPLIADLRGYIFQKSDALMLFIQYSHSPFINSNIVKGYSVEFGVGYQFKLFENVFSLEAGIKGRRVSFVNEEILSSSHNARLNGFNIKIGYQF